jgi:FAD dependent oxidoreductase
MSSFSQNLPMATIRTWLLYITFLPAINSAEAQQIISVDICVYGSTSGGVIAAYTASRLGKKVVLISESTHPGGLSSGGLGNTDIGNKSAITGLARDFYKRVGQHYGKPEQWIFEPHVAEEIYFDYINKEKISVLFNQRLQSVKKTDKRIQEIVISSNATNITPTIKTIKAKEFIDCSYEGDLMAKALVSYTIGREDNQQYNETHNGVQLLDKHQFPDGMDPYQIPGKPESGVLWGVNAQSPAARGTGDKKIQAYNFRICLTDSIQNRIEITRPEGYDSTRYDLLLRYIQSKKPINLEDGLLNINQMPGRKTDINNNGPFSTDMIGMNYDYPEGNYSIRKKIIKDHIDYDKGLLYFLGHDNRIPDYLRNEMLKWGYPLDEYPDNDHWSPQLYIRESRRMIGEYVMTEANCVGTLKVTDSIGEAAYTMDSHNCERIILNGMVKNEGDVQIGGFPPYPISFRAIVPKRSECNNLLVPVCLSASHIAYGSIRMEPVFMVLGQSSAIAAVLAIDMNLPIQEIPVSKLQKELTEDPLATRHLK